MSYCPSSGCNYQPCSQSQKMSIGLVVHSVAKPHYGSTKEAQAVSIKKAKEGTSNQRQLLVGQSVKKDLKASGSLNTSKGHVQEGSVRTKTGSLTPNMPIKDSKQAFTSAMMGFHDKKVSQPTSMQPSVGKKIGAERYDEFSRGDKQVRMPLPVKGTLREQSNEMETRSKETLRMKLQEILGNVSSAKRKFGDSRTVDVVANEVIPERTHECDTQFKPRQNSDTIETDSENADVTIRAPVTRSLARRRVPARTQLRKSKTTVSCDKGEHQGNHTFSFAENSSQPCQVNFGCLIPEKNDNAKRSCGIKPGDMQFHVTDVVNIQRVIAGGKKLPPAEDLLLGGKMLSPEHACADENNELEEETLNKNINHSPVIREKDQQPDADCPVPPEESEHDESFGYKSPAHLDDNMTRPVPHSPMSFFPLINEKKNHVNGFAQPEGRASLKATCIIKSSPLTDDDNSGSSDDAAMPDKAYASTPEPSTEEENDLNRLCTPERGEFDSAGEASSAKQVHPEDIYTSPETEDNRNPMLFRTKRHCSHGVDCSDLSPSSPTPKASRNTDDALMEGLEESPEDEFARVVSLLGLALERVNNKMMSVTNKRCSAILMSATEEILAQLRDVESQIQMDLGKLTSLNKAKRKHLETRLQEQHENLKVIYEKFKEEIRNYLQNCRGQMEELETHHVEVKAAIERQKAIHGKLLMQADTAVETHLNDAQRRITSVHKLGRQKMQKLKVAIAECLKDGISS